MAKLVYFTVASVDGYIADGEYDWSAPGQEVFAFITNALRPIGTYLCGRRNYETMVVWDTPEVIPTPPPGTLEFARVWQAAEKIVYSRSLDAVSAPNTRLEREFHPPAIREWKARSPRDLSVSGPTLAAEAIRAGLVDEIHLLIPPATLGGGIPVLPKGERLKLRLLDECRLPDGWVSLRYTIQP